MASFVILLPAQLNPNGCVNVCNFVSLPFGRLPNAIAGTFSVKGLMSRTLSVLEDVSTNNDQCKNMKPGNPGFVIGVPIQPIRLSLSPAPSRPARVQLGR